MDEIEEIDEDEVIVSSVGDDTISARKNNGAENNEKRARKGF